MTLLTYVWGQSGPTCWSSHEQVLLFPQNMTKHVISRSCYTVIICPSCQVVEGMMVEWQMRMLPSHWPQLESMFRHFWVLTHWIFLTSDHSVPTFVNGSGTFPALFVAKKNRHFKLHCFPHTAQVVFVYKQKIKHKETQSVNLSVAWQKRTLPTLILAIGLYM